MTGDELDGIDEAALGRAWVRFEREKDEARRRAAALDAQAASAEARGDHATARRAEAEAAALRQEYAIRDTAPGWARMDEGDGAPAEQPAPQVGIFTRAGKRPKRHAEPPPHVPARLTVQVSRAELEALPGREGEALRLRHLRGVGFNRVARLMGVTRSEARALARRGLRMLAEARTPPAE